jgi:D-amino-acid dehydrogenase
MADCHPPPRKHAVVIGGGLVGVATANSLARGGVDVTVVERGPSVALGTSFGNAGRFAVTALLDGPLSSPGTAYRTIWNFVRGSFSSKGALYFQYVLETVAVVLVCHQPNR